MGRIRRLPDDLINQIAAGEVVERPASVVKELAENAVDAQATVVRVQLAEGGLGAISIIDDGHGMSRDDAVLCLERHATSKLLDADGLFQITTKGFRGEAMPSIASVSRFTLTTSEPGAMEGTRLVVEGGAPAHLEVVAPAPGTRVDVEELFFNTPARRKFLKRESTELAHCEEAVVRLALAHPDVGFFLEHGGRPLISSPATADLKERIGGLLGSAVMPHLLEVSEQRLGLTISGFIASPEFTLPTARSMYTFVNRRYVRDRGVNSAVQRAFQDTLPPGRQPVTVLFIDLDTRAVDVNVHPQKLEVRFADPRSVQEALSAAIGRSLKAAPWRDAQPQPDSPEVHAQYAMAVDRFLSRVNEGAPLVPEAPAVQEGRAGFGTARPMLNEAPPPGYYASLRWLGELGRRFWLCEGHGGTLVILDPRAVAERLALDGLMRRHRKGTLASAPATLFSASLDAGADAPRLLEAAEGLARLGIELDSFGGETIVVRRVPVELETLPTPRLLTLLLELTEADPASDLEGALSLVAYELVDEAQRPPGPDEARSQLARLDEVDFSVPARRPAVVVQELPLLELEARTR